MKINISKTYYSTTDFVEFLALITEVTLRTIKYKLGHELYAKVYCDTPVEELYSILDTPATPST